MRQVRRIGVESATFHVCFELFLPFFVYLIAEHIHVSGILSVVAAGLLFSYLHPGARPARAGTPRCSRRASGSPPKTCGASSRSC